MTDLTLLDTIVRRCIWSEDDWLRLRLRGIVMFGASAANRIWLTDVFCAAVVAAYRREMMLRTFT